MKFGLANWDFVLQRESFSDDWNPALTNNFKTYEGAFFRIRGPQDHRASIGEQLELREAGLRRYIFLARLHDSPGRRYGPGLDRRDGSIVVFKSCGGEISICGPSIKHSQSFPLDRHEFSGRIYREFVPLFHDDGGAAIAKVNLFNDLSLQESPVAIPSRGSSLLAKTVSTKLKITTTTLSSST